MHIRRTANGDRESLIHDIIAAKEKEAAAKPTFTFPAALTSKRPMKSGMKRRRRGFASLRK